MSGGWGSATTTTPSDAASAMHQTASKQAKPSVEWPKQEKLDPKEWPTSRTSRWNLTTSQILHTEGLYVIVITKQRSKFNTELSRTRAWIVLKHSIRHRFAIFIGDCTSNSQSVRSNLNG
eukprot:SAG31_NODE_5040_length_2781_cov_2.356078_4_plen_120_part_00